MPQARYETLLLQRAHPVRRWETTPAEGFSWESLDADEIIRTVRLGIAAGRLPETTGNVIPEILDRLELRTAEGRLRNAALVLFGRRMASDFRNAACVPRAFAVLIKTSSSTTVFTKGTCFTCSTRRWHFCTATCRSADASWPPNWSASKSCRSLSPRCARRWSTHFAIATTQRRAVP
ncbi:hypothetical protein [Geminisphaera colitermitum]|uniref:hypothetical protein n=1 Tax=Geminisphaera colitermitum TaxID=1148786 RepID=UPI0018E3CC26|nr:hypothetical protein [Geminisphaera colitermitum]